MTLLITIIVLALIFDYINGFHDAANSIATVVSTKALTPIQAVAWAAFFNFSAYFIFKDHGVANTIAKTVNEGTNAAGVHYITLTVILAGVLAAILWNLLTWWFGIPSSSSHTLIGGFAGAAIAHTGFESINTIKILEIASFIVLAPAIGMFVAFLISLWFLHSFKKNVYPKLLSVGVIIALLVFMKYALVTDPEKLRGGYSSYLANVVFDGHNFKLIIVAFVVFAMALFTLFLNSLYFLQAERWFKRMQLLSTAVLSIGHGGNDAQKVMGIIMAAMVAYDPRIYTLDHMLWWNPIACYTAIALGTLSGGWKIIKTMGTRITKITPFEGVAADTASAITLFLTEYLKIPVSTTHTITGSIIGVGATKRLSAVRWGVTINLLWAWILTIPVSALIAMVFYLCLSLFGLE
ncbi:MAG: inorganic phosphate transporter [Chitinophagales bacterium]|nr:inorganic phosphate transporter [Chitinophagales bacterium]